MKVSLVTGTRNRPGPFQRLVKSVIEHTDVPWEMIVADASDEPVTCDDPRIRILRESPPLGCSKGYNRAFRECRGEWVLWLNDDVEVLPGYASAAIAFMQGHQETGLGALFYSEGSKGFHINAYFGMVYANFGIMNRKFGDEIGWFDDDLPHYGSDNALAFRVLLAGKGIAGIPDARLIHHAIWDEQRIKNNDQNKRLADVERLTAKYGALLPEMKRVYQANIVFPLLANDQTPPWLR